MLDSYRAAFRAPGSAAFCAASFVMRLPIAIYPITLVLIVSARTGHYGFAGVLAGIYVAANGIGNPVLARLVDRFGQSRMLLPASAVHLAATVGLAVLIESGSPQWTFVGPTIVSGFAYLAVGSLVRARWSHVWGRRPELSTAYSLESTLDEVIFTTGPLVATAIATTLDPVLALVLAMALISAGALWLRGLRATEPPPASRASSARLESALRQRGMVLLPVSSASMGALFASAEVTMVAFCSQHGHRALSGAVLACFAMGSGVAGFLYGARSRPAPALDRFRFQALVLGSLPVLFLLAPNVPVLAVCAFVVGLGIAPTLITASAIIEEIVDRAVLTEGLAWLITGLSLGYGVGSAVVGGVADAHGARLAFLVTVASGLLVAATALAVHARLAAPEPVAVT
jgi:MFS family permease